MGKSEKVKPLADITELECWREAREFVKQIYDLTGPSTFSKDPLIVELLRGQAIAVMSKISQGYHHLEKKVFFTYLNEAIGHLGETISHLYIAFDQKYLGREELNDTLNKAYVVGIRINSYLKSLK